METAAPYQTQRSKAEDATIRRALRIMQNRLREPGMALSSSGIVRDYLTLLLGDREHEAFVVVFLDALYRVIAAEEMFRGGLTDTAIHPREVVKRALALNAGGVVFAHNHPSGSPIPSEADHFITAHLKSALALVDVLTLDHIIIAGGKAVSFVECDWVPFGKVIPRLSKPEPVEAKPKRERTRKGKMQ